MKLKDLLFICILVTLAVLIITSCKPIANNSESQETDSVDALIMATLFNNMAAEYQALCHQAYNIATYRIDQFKEDTLNAIVLDIDETVMNNSPFQASMVECKKYFSPEAWKQWCEVANASSIPGVVDFLNYAHSKKFKIFYVSNRTYDVLTRTMHNMDSLGFPQIVRRSYLLKVDTGDKQIRRDSITNVMGYNIVMLCGDQLGDFYQDTNDSTRMQMMNDSASKFGDRFIVLPNAMYGTNWTASIGLDTKNPTTVRKLIKKAASDFTQHCDSIQWQEAN